MAKKKYSQEYIERISNTINEILNDKTDYEISVDIEVVGEGAQFGRTKRTGILF